MPIRLEKERASDLRGEVTGRGTKLHSTIGKRGGEVEKGRQIPSWDGKNA